jgi:hypothetical protein
MSPLTRLAQVEQGAPRDHVAAMADEGSQALLQIQQLRATVDQRHHVDAENGLQLGMLVKIVQQDFGDLATLEIDDDAHAVLVGLVAQTMLGDALDFLFAHQLGDLLDQACLVDLVG